MQQNSPRALQFAYYLLETKVGKFLFASIFRIRLTLFIFFVFTHALYWLTAWWSPYPYLVFMLVGVWFGQGILKPWGIIVSQSMQEHWDPYILKMAIPFIVLNYAAVFACLYMLGVVSDGDGNPIKGTWQHFYFSTVTLTTLGYGNLTPTSFFSELVAVIEAIVGFIGFAVLAGIVASIVLKRAEFNENA